MTIRSQNETGPQQRADTSKMLDRRYDDLKSGRVKPIDGEEAFRQLAKRFRLSRDAREIQQLGNKLGQSIFKKK